MKTISILLMLCSFLFASPFLDERIADLKSDLPGQPVPPQFSSVFEDGIYLINVVPGITVSEAYADRRTVFNQKDKAYSLYITISSGKVASVSGVTSESREAISGVVTITEGAATRILKSPDPLDALVHARKNNELRYLTLHWKLELKLVLLKTVGIFLTAFNSDFAKLLPLLQ